MIVRLWTLHWKPCDSEAVNFALKAMWWSGCSPPWHLLHSFLQVLSPTPVGQWIHLATPRPWPTCWEALASRTWSSSVSTMRSRDTWPKGSSWSLTGGKAGVRLWQFINIKKHLLVNYMSTLFNKQREFFCAWKASHRHDKKDLNCLQWSPGVHHTNTMTELVTVTLTEYASKYKVHKLYQGYSFRKHPPHLSAILPEHHSVSDSRWHAMECEPCSALLHSQAERDLHLF